MFIELNFRKIKWLLLGTYQPPNQNDGYFFRNISNGLDTYIKTYDKLFILPGDFKAEVLETKNGKCFRHTWIGEFNPWKTCFKSSTNPTCVDLVLSNSRNSFKDSTVISADMSDSHEMIVTVLKTTIAKGKPRQILYRDYKHFTNQVFKNDLASKLNATTESRRDLKNMLLPKRK